jgi:hypothetical protein
MQQLLRFEAIGNNIFSIFPNSNPEENTHIKFGGWDQAGLQSGENLHMIRTLGKQDWSVSYTGF